ncbi:hypothetical protein [Nitrosomonas sp.]|uniref:hypothetical protein n=1 Tax=Nitrosomonas sp. TaxID=42353 RepID=UPI0026046BAE|nr:hypothetical protein [Nitrosomonas sp.]
MPAINLNSSLGLETDLPLALFPVRLETHFADDELLVRIYPDTVHVDSFEPELTETEIAWGRNFWIHTWRAGNDKAQARSAWAQLAEHFGAARAAWIAQKLTPKNPEKQPSNPISAEAKLPAEPEFPKPETHTDAWTRAPYTQILPDKWIALIYESEDSEPLIYDEGKPIKLPLHVGISPDKNKGLNADAIENDDKVGWLINFNKAEEMGMGLRIPYASAKPIKRLMVLGVNTAFDGKQGQTKLQELIRAHHHTQGISFLPQGTPTNNTDDVVSGYSTLDPGFENSYRVEREPASDLIENSNRAITAQALGIDVLVHVREADRLGIDDVLAHVREADSIEQFNARIMNATLWQATWGYFLEQMMAGSNAPTDKELRLARAHFERYVRARGPLPAIRVGVQPYGLLPVISLKHWEVMDDDTSIDKPLAAFLYKLRETWKAALVSVPKVPGGSGTFDELQNILNLNPVSVAYHRRAGQRIARLSPSSESSTHDSSESSKHYSSGNQAWENKMQGSELTWIPRHIRMVYGDYPSNSQWPGGMITPPGATGNKDKEFFNYLSTSSYDEILLLKLNSESNPLSHWLLREACLREYLVAAIRILKLPPEERTESEFEEGEIPALWNVLGRSDSSLDPPKVSDYLDNIKQQLSSHDFNVAKIPKISVELASELGEFSSFFRNLDYLSKLASEASALLDELFRETLDLCSHRYDAWATSLATKRLESMRNKPKKSKGIYLGGYGWVEDLKQGAATEENHGFVHAPSLAHATTAALLRSGYLSRTDQNDREALAVNLSSERIRNALWLLDGVRQGQSLGALLGYRFERGLHENHPGLILDQYIPIFRKIAPLDITTYSEDAINAQPVNQVVDGLELLYRWRPNPDPTKPNPFEPIPWGQYGLPDQINNADKYNACVKELKNLEDAVDAIGDLVLAESVHQIAQGNPVRAGATLSAIAEGEAPPPELDVIRTPRTGIAITHRIAVIFTGLPKGPVWGSQTARARAEPFLNAWAAQLFGPRVPQAACSVVYHNAENSIISDPLTITLDQLGLAPIDLLYLPESEGDAQRSELEQRIIYLVQQSLPATQTSATEIRLNFVPSPGSSNAILSFAEVLEIVRVARKLITSSQVLSSRNLAQPGQSIPLEAEEDTVRAGESADSPLALSERIKLTLKNFTDAYTKLFIDFQEDKTAVIDFGMVRKRLEQLSNMAGVLAEDSSERLIDCQTIRDNLMQLSLYSLADAIPIAPIGETPKVQKTLLSQLQSILDVIEKRYDRIKTLTDSHNNLKTEDKTSAVMRDYHVARMREIFGQEFRVLPRFSPINAADLRTTFLASNELQNNNPLESVTWFQRIARVREGAARLDAVLMYAEAIGESKLGFSVGQLPYDPKKDPKERWVALPGDLPGSRLSLVVHAPADLDLANPVAGLLIDEWVEVVPSKEEITGLAFHFDAPQSRAPQAILLAVPPNKNSEWNLEILADTLLETLELAKFRAVDLSRLLHPKHDGSKPNEPGTLTDIGQFLPALYFSQARAPEWKEKAPS